MTSYSRNSFVASFVLTALVSSQLVSATCYWQNSTTALTDPYSIATDDTPCFPNQENSPCCGTGWSCMSDGVCKITEQSQDFYYRGTCTDKTWNSQQCPGWCFAQNSNTSIPLIKCTKTSGEDWYCCPGDANCSCDTGKNAVKLGASPASTVTVIGSTSWPGYISTSTRFTASPLVSSGTSTGTVSATSSLTTGNIASQTSSANQNASRSSHNNSALAIGLGTGLGIAVILAIVGIVFFLKRRNKARNVRTEIKGTYGGIPSSSQASNHPIVASHYVSDILNEKDGSTIVEAPAENQQIFEMHHESRNSRQELDSHGAGQHHRAELE